jgi:hypothetical protein
MTDRHCKADIGFCRHRARTLGPLRAEVEQRLGFGFRAAVQGCAIAG